jgi:hypothetical protein
MGGAAIIPRSIMTKRNIKKIQYRPTIFFWRFKHPPWGWLQIRERQAKPAERQIVFVRRLPRRGMSPFSALTAVKATQDARLSGSYSC